MPRLLLAAALAAALAGCAVPMYTQVQLPPGDPVALSELTLGGGVRYLIDPRSETCVLVNQQPYGPIAVLVSCAKLKANVPEAARLITWEERAPVR